MKHFGKVARDRGYELPEELVQKGWSKWESLVPHNSDASMDMVVLQILLREFIRRGHPVCLVFLIGTTLDCAFDNVQEGCKILRETPGYDKNLAWVHVDAAWCGPYLRLLQIAQASEDYGDRLAMTP